MLVAEMIMFLQAATPKGVVWTEEQRRERKHAGKQQDFAVPGIVAP